MEHDTRHVFNRHFLYGLLCFALLMFSLPSNATDVVNKGKLFNCFPKFGGGGGELFLNPALCIDGAIAQKVVADHCQGGKYTRRILGNMQYTSSLKCYIDHSTIPPGSTYPGEHSIITSAYTWGADGCPTSHPTDNGDGTCSPAPPPIICGSPEVSKEIQRAQYACQLENPNTQLYDLDFKWSCTDVDGQSFPDVGTSCNYEPNGCIVGLNCDEAGQDVPVCNPESQECEIPLPDNDNPLPEPDPLPPTDQDYCSLHPDVCGDTSPPPSEPEPNPSPDISDIPDNPDLSQGDNTIAKELTLSNKHLENINQGIRDFDSKASKQLALSNKLAQHQLGAAKDTAKVVKSTTGAIISSIQDGNRETTKTNEKLDKIACLLDEECANEGKPKPSVTMDCTASLFSCEGDVIQCEILRLQWKDSCISNELSDLEGALSDIVNVDSEAMLVDSENVLDYSQMDTHYLENGVSFGTGLGTCPAPAVINLDLKTIGNYTIDFSYEPACEWAEIMNPLVHIAGWIFGLFIIFRAGGGS